MKKIITLLMFICPTISFGQDNPKRIAPGIKAGIVFANVSPNTFTDDGGNKHKFTPRFGVIVGGRFQIPAGKNLLFMPELNLAPRGANRDVDYTTGNSYEMSPALSTTLEIAPNLLFRTRSAKGSFFIGGGPFVAFNLDEYAEFIGKSDAGINLLTGYLLPIGFSFEFNFNKGFKKQISENLFTQVPPDITTTYFGFSVGYAF
jgi:hypothetical protein